MREVMDLEIWKHRREEMVREAEQDNVARVPLARAARQGWRVPRLPTRRRWRPRQALDKRVGSVAPRGQSLDRNTRPI